MRATPHDYYLEYLERILREVPYSEDEIGRIMRATGMAWEVLFRGRLIEASPEPTEWEAKALGLIFDSIRKAIDAHPLSEKSRSFSGEPLLRIFPGGKQG